MAKTNYLKAVLSDNSVKEEKYLKQLVSLGYKLKINTTRYKQELKKFSRPHKAIKKTTLVKKPLVKKTKNIKKYKNSSYDITSVSTKGSNIYINFNRRISSKDMKFFELHYKNLHKDIFDIQGRFKKAKPTKLKIKGINKVSVSQHKKKTLRIVLSNRTNVKTVYVINKKQIIIKSLGLKKPLRKTTIAKKVPIQYKRTNKRKVIVLDAGHGGKDAGAVGPRKRYEKIVVLKVTKYLQNYLKQRGYKIYLTRTSDRFIKVRNRTILANKKKADIFISVHANAAHKTKVKKLQGIETFFLSPARSSRAKRVAALENKSDIRKMNYSSKNTFLTILNQSKITASNKLAIDVQQNMLYSTRKLYKDVVDSGVREGPFWVLVGAQMPSILVELGYISHPKESKRLYSTQYQRKIALGIANGVDAYFSKNP